MKKVVCALLVSKGRLLITQHASCSENAGYWEFPGGKVKPGEVEETALMREIQEELHINVLPFDRLEPVEFTKNSEIIELIPYVCQWINGNIHLTEHAEFQWVEPKKIQAYNLLPADCLIIENGGNFKKLINYSRKQL